MKSQSATTPQAGPPQSNSAPCKCGCKGGAGCTCSQAVCFERPHYFCGQLLNDTDLSAGQTYFREKLKLYHRTLHGTGVVCGLRLTCDPECCGSVRIGDGYAIDDCGNDLVVCQPITFDVITALKALKAKKLLITDEPRDPCRKEDEPRCKVKQCFYITICCDEVEAEFTTPFKTTTCGPAAAACLPTRIKETVRFEVFEEPNKPRNALDEIEERITRGWEVFTSGPLFRTLKEHVDHIRETEARDRDYNQLFCQLKVLFQHYLKK
jgi:hypothetical protein